AVSLGLLAQGLPIFYDMHTGFYGTPLLTVMLAQGCVFACWQLSILLSKTPLLSPLLQSIGAMSLGIMLLHKAIPFLPGYSRLQGHTESSAFVAALVSSWLLSLLLNRFSLTRALFLGSEKDWNGLLRPTAVLRETTATARASPLVKELPHRRRACRFSRGIRQVQRLHHRTQHALVLIHGPRLLHVARFHPRPPKHRRHLSPAVPRIAVRGFVEVHDQNPITARPERGPHR